MEQMHGDLNCFEIKVLMLKEHYMTFVIFSKNVIPLRALTEDNASVIFHHRALSLSDFLSYKFHVKLHTTMSLNIIMYI